MHSTDRLRLWAWISIMAVSTTTLLVSLQRLVTVDPLFAPSGGETTVMGLSPVARFDLMLGVFVIGWLMGTSFLMARQGSWLWIPAVLGFFLVPGLVEWMAGVAEPQPVTVGPWQAVGFHFMDLDLAGLTRFVWLGSMVETLVVGLIALPFRRRPMLGSRPTGVLVAGLVAVAGIGFFLGEAMSGDPGLVPQLVGLAVFTYCVAAAAEVGKTRYLVATIAVVYGLFLGGLAGLIVTALGLVGLAVRNPPHLLTRPPHDG